MIVTKECNNKIFFFPFRDRCAQLVIVEVINDSDFEYNLIFQDYTIYTNTTQDPDLWCREASQEESELFKVISL